MPIDPAGYPFVDVGAIQAGSNIIGSVRTQPLASLNAGPTLFNNGGAAVPAATASTNSALFAVTKGQRVFFSLNVSGLPTTAGDRAQITINGVTSGVFFAICGAGNSISGYFDVGVTETIQFSYVNSDTVAHWIQGSAWSMSP